MSEAPVIIGMATRRGLLRRGIDALQRHYGDRHLELLRADDVTTSLTESPDQLSLRARAVARYLGRPIQVGDNPLAGAAPLRLCQVETEEGPKVRLLLTDDGVEQLRRRLGIRCLITDGPKAEGEFTDVRVQAVFLDGDVVEQVGRSLTSSGDADRKARSAAIRAVIYGFCGIPASTRVSPLAPDLLTADMIHRAEPSEVDAERQPAAAVPAIEADTSPETAAIEAPAAIPSVAFQAAPPPSPMSTIRDDDDELDVARTRIYRYLARSGWTNDEEVSEQLSYWLGVPAGTSVAQLDPPCLLMAAEEIEHWLPTRHAELGPSVSG